VGLTLAVLIAGLIGLGLTTGNLGGLGLVPVRYSVIARTPGCEEVSNTLVLMAQAVPSAQMLPCLSALPVGWQYEGLSVKNGEAFFYLGSDRGGFRSVRVRLSESCNIEGATPIPYVEEPGAAAYQRTLRLPPKYNAVNYFLFDGGCVTYRYEFVGPFGAVLVKDASSALSFYDRAQANEEFERETGLVLSTP
jgi:hypothetical protein